MKHINSDGMFSKINLHKNENDESVSISVTNPVVKLPQRDLEIIPNFVTDKESQDVLQEIYATIGDKHFAWEGFEIKRKVLRFFIDDDCSDGSEGVATKQHTLNSTLPTLQLLVDRVNQASGSPSRKNPISQISVEEYHQSQLCQHLNLSKSQVSTFETSATCSLCCSTAIAATTSMSPQTPNCKKIGRAHV